jgi:hypothetical protein
MGSAWIGMLWNRIHSCPLRPWAAAARGRLGHSDSDRDDSSSIQGLRATPPLHGAPVPWAWPAAACRALPGCGTKSEALQVQAAARDRPGPENS